MCERRYGTLASSLRHPLRSAARLPGGLWFKQIMTSHSHVVVHDCKWSKQSRTPRCMWQVLMSNSYEMINVLFGFAAFEARTRMLTSHQRQAPWTKWKGIASKKVVKSRKCCKITHWAISGVIGQTANLIEIGSFLHWRRNQPLTGRRIGCNRLCGFNFWVREVTWCYTQNSFWVLWSICTYILGLIFEYKLEYCWYCWRSSQRAPCSWSRRQLVLACRTALEALNLWWEMIPDDSRWSDSRWYLTYSGTYSTIQYNSQIFTEIEIWSLRYQLACTSNFIMLTSDSAGLVICPLRRPKSPCNELAYVLMNSNWTAWPLRLALQLQSSWNPTTGGYRWTTSQIVALDRETQWRFTVNS